MHRMLQGEKRMITRRKFLAVSSGAVTAAAYPSFALGATEAVCRKAGVKLKLGLNAYSFNGPLQAGSMTLADAVAFCAENGVDAIDATGYYFPGYPKVPPDDYVYGLKRTAFINGVAISGTGVRNNFAVTDKAARARDVQMVKDWIVVASKLSAPVIRVFSGPERPAGHTFDEALVPHVFSRPRLTVHPLVGSLARSERRPEPAGKHLSERCDGLRDDRRVVALTWRVDDPERNVRRRQRSAEEGPGEAGLALAFTPWAEVVRGHACGEACLFGLLDVLQQLGRTDLLV